MRINKHVGITLLILFVFTRLVHAGAPGYPVSSPEDRALEAALANATVPGAYPLSRVPPRAQLAVPHRVQQASAMPPMPIAPPALTPPALVQQQPAVAVSGVPEVSGQPGMEAPQQVPAMVMPAPVMPQGYSRPQPALLPVTMAAAPVVMPQEPVMPQVMPETVMVPQNPHPVAAPVPAGVMVADPMTVPGNPATMAVDEFAIPVPTRNIMPGEVISEEDLAWLPSNPRRVPMRTALQPEELVGKSPRRPLVAGRAVSLTALATSGKAGGAGGALAVKKGDLVTLKVESPFLQLSAQGRSLDNGSIGDVIRVSNTSSKKVVEGMITAPQTVRIMAMGQ